MTSLQIEFEITELQTAIGACQLVTLNLTPPQELQIQTDKRMSVSDRILPSELATLQLPAELDLSKGIIINGRAPIWLYSHLVHRCQSASWVACANIHESGAVVISSRMSSPQIGEKVIIPTRSHPGIAILIGGPPDSGKSVFSYTLQRSLRQYFADHHSTQQVYLHRANWDGEGNWTFESEAGVSQKLIQRSERRLHLEENGIELVRQYFLDKAAIMKQMRNIVDVVLVDVGGRVQEEKHPLIDQCSHFIVVSSKSGEIRRWQKMCGDRGLQNIAVVHSTLETRNQVLTYDSCLEIEAGPWRKNDLDAAPDVSRILAEIIAELEAMVS
jgi:CRISPR-associated protein Csx3